MKFVAALFAASTLAEKGDRQGKHGRKVFSDPRGSSDPKFIWQTPICLANPSNPACDPSCQIETTALSGEIRIDTSNYENRRSCLWTIRVAATHRLVFEFERDDGFGLEYHEYCGYDKLHIFSGSPSSEIYRHARFCGPKGKPDTKNEGPYDGSGKIVPIDGKMPFWDIPYDMGTNEAVIGVDLDQNRNHFGGFTLKWNAVENVQTNFTDVYDCIDFAKEYLERQLQDVFFQNMRAKEKTQEKLKKLISKAADAIHRNPNNKMRKYLPSFFPSANKFLRCAVPDTEPVPEWIQSKFQTLENSPRSILNFDHGITALRGLIEAYIGECKIGSVWWPRRIEKFLTKLNDAACDPWNEDCR